MNTVKKILLFSLILLVGLSVVNAVEIIDDDTSDISIETSQVEQTNNNQPITQNVQEKDNNIEQISNNDVEISNDLTITSTNVGCYDNKNWTVNQGVTITGTTDVPLTNVAITINGNSVTLDNLEISNAAGVSNYIINATEKTDLTVKNSKLTITNTDVSDNTFCIYLKDVNGVEIKNNEITTNAPSRGMEWDSCTVPGSPYPVYYSIPSVASILVDSSEDVEIKENIIAIAKSGAYNSGSTMPAIVFRNQTNSSSVTENVITASGAQYVYGLMVADEADDLLIKDNAVTVNGEYNVVGIDASTSTNSKVCQNIIIATSYNAGPIPYGSESLAYGILSDTYTTGNRNNIICNNNIQLSGNVIYGVEVYLGNNITVCTNTIRGNGQRVMGVAFAHTTDSKIINNDIQISGNTNAINYFYEEVTPENTGIILTNQSNTNTIKGNTIIVTAFGDSSVLGINLTNDTSNTVNNNYIKAITYTDEEIAQNPLLQNKEGINAIAEYADDDVTAGNTIAILEPCNCPCDCGTSTDPIDGGGENPNDISALNKKSLKTDDEPGIIYINDDNYSDYSTSYTMGSTGGLNIYFNHMDPNNHVIVNFTQPVELIGFQGDEFKSLTINVTQCSNTSGLYVLSMPIANNVYAPNAILCYVTDKAVNCTVAGLSLGNTKATSIIENCTIINLNGPTELFSYFVVQGYRGSVKNCYVFLYRPQNNTYFVGRSGVLGVSQGSIENITPSNENYHILNNTNYAEFFDENNIIKEEYADSIIYATENITSPVIIDKKVTLSAVRGHTGYNSVKFIEGSDESTIEDSLINNLELNGAFLINVHNNKLIGENAQINLIESSNCIIENNIVNTEKEYTITLDENSMDNTIKNNELTAAQYTGDKSVQNTAENMIEDNTPISEEESLITLTEDNILNYATLTGNNFNLSSEKLNNKEVIINFNTTNSFYISQNFTLIADYNTQAHSLIGSTGYFYNITNLYAPQAELRLGANPTGTQSIINSTVAIISLQGLTNPTLIQDNIIIDLRTAYPIFLNGRNNTIINNYIVRYSGGSLQVGPYITLMNRGPSTFTGNTREYYPPNLLTLTNANYNTYFDVGTNIIKEAYANKILFAVENITSPVIINQKNVTLSAIRGMTGYAEVSFIEGSENSKIEDSYIKHLTLNKTNNITIDENKLIDLESQIEIIKSQDNIIENNTINTTLDYTIIIKDSTNNNINNNQLNALELTDEESIQTITSQKELKVDTTEFTVGTTSTIKASIYLGDEVASDINGGKIVFKVDGKTLKDANGKVIYAKLTNGVATIEDYEIPTNWNKEGLTITAVYSGSKDCEALISEATDLSITPEQINPTINTDQMPTTATVGSTVQLKAQITDGTNSITAGKVVFKVNGKTVKDANGKVVYASVDSNGEVTVDYTIPENMKAKDYTVTITFTSAKYGILTANTTLTVTKT